MHLDERHVFNQQDSRVGRPYARVSTTTNGGGSQLSASCCGLIPWLSHATGRPSIHVSPRSHSVGWDDDHWKCLSTMPVQLVFCYSLPSKLCIFEWSIGNVNPRSCNKEWTRFRSFSIMPFIFPFRTVIFVALLRLSRWWPWRGARRYNNKGNCETCLIWVFHFKS